MKSFTEKVIKVVSKIPGGKVLTYKQVACRAKSPRASRTVGNILNKNYNNGSKIPCHRVIRSNGSIGGYAKGTKKKKELLKKEGFNIKSS